MKENLPENRNQNQPELDWRGFSEAVRKIYHPKDGITPELSADEVWDRITKRNKHLENHPGMNEKIKTVQKKFMERHGINPEEWIYYTDSQPKDTKKMEFTGEDMERVAGNFPKGFEFFAAPGRLITNYNPDSQESTMHFNENYWTIYIKRYNQAQIEEPK